MTNPLVTKILAFCNEPYLEVLAPQKGYRNTSFGVVRPDGTRSNLILYKHEPDIVAKIKRAHTVSTLLAEQGFAVRRTLDGRIIHLQSPSSSRYAALYNYLPGHTIPWEAYTRRHLVLLGKTMSDMHAALASSNQQVHHSVAREYLALIKRMDHYFAQVGVHTALRQKLGLTLAAPNTTFEQLGAVLEACDQLRRQHALHMDLVRGNVLFQGKGDQLRISGIIDFEKTAHGHPLFDVARTLAFLLADCKYLPEIKVRRYFLQSGYRKHGQAVLPKVTVRTAQGQHDLLEILVDLFLLHDLYKFLRHNPYQSLPENEHFVRTRELLLCRALIKKA